MLHLPRKHRSGGHGVPQKHLCLAVWLTVAPAAVLFAAESNPTHRVTAVRHWSQDDVTRIAVEIDGDFRSRSGSLHDPERVYFDLVGTQPALGDKGVTVIPVSDRFVRQIRVAETQHGVTRIVLDMDVVRDVSTSRLENPDRLIIEVRPVNQASGLKKAPAQSAPPVTTAIASVEPSAPPLEMPASKPERRQFQPPVITPASAIAAKRATATFLDPPPSVQSPAAGPQLAMNVLPKAPAPVTPPAAVPAVSKPSLPASGPAALPAKRNSSGDRSMIRVLGLKVGRIVIDPGHGGHDTGTIGPGGLREKDLVLDVSRRLGALIEDRMNSEVIYTRSDDTFIPLERRTEVANEAKADLFLSIHANSSPLPTAAGVETYYLNFTTSRSALELAARENAGSQKSIFELQDLLQKIALKDKVEESREFANRIESALYPVSAKGNARAKDRGVKKAPFVVLIGASMPSVLAEIGFISNEKDEGNMRRADYRQRIAEALYKGLAGYANTLSHFQVAQRE